MTEEKPETGQPAQADPSPAPAPTPPGWKRVLRLAVFLLCPVYIIWSIKLGSGNLFAWPGSELVAWLVLTLLWCAAWGFAALAHLRRLRLAAQRRGEK